MGEVVNVIVAFAVIVFIFRWATSSGGEPSPEAAAARALRFRPKNVTPEMTDTISGMFPDIPRENIHYDLLRTGSVELTSNKILERGFLDAPPPAYFTLYTRSSTTTAATAAIAGAGARTGAAAAASAKRKPETLISRFRLEDRVAAAPAASPDAALPAPEEAGGRAVWEDSAERREASLRERKAQMVLAARQRMLAQQQQKAAEKAS